MIVGEEGKKIEWRKPSFLWRPEEASHGVLMSKNGGLNEESERNWRLEQRE